MNIFIVTLGSRGDVQPYVALGKKLQAKGHTVTLCTSQKFESFITEHGLDYGYASNDLLDLMDSQEGLFERANGVVGAIKTTLELREEANRITKKLLHESWEAAQEANPDLILYHPKALGGVSIAEKLGIPAMLAMLQPLLVPTAAFPAVGIPDWGLGGWYNKLTYKLVQMGYQTYRGTANTFREEAVGLEALPTGRGILNTAEGQPLPVLHAFSEHVVPRPEDWPRQVHLTGYWFLDQGAAWTPPADLQAFLAAGEPPVYVGFGSMAGREPQRLANLTIKALQWAGVRGILATGWGGLAADDLPNNIFKLAQAPHDWLFPRMAAVVHHGGAGTTAAGLRAGTPTIICPFFGDQPFWGERVHALGVGSEPIPQKQLTVDRLAAAISDLMTNIAVRRRARALGQKLRAEDGIGNAIALIEREMARA